MSYFLLNFKDSKTWRPTYTQNYLQAIIIMKFLSSFASLSVTWGVLWRDTSEENAWLLEAKDFFGFLCAHQNDALRRQKPRTCFASLLSELRKENLLDSWLRREERKWLLFFEQSEKSTSFFRPIREEHCNNSKPLARISTLICMTND